MHLKNFFARHSKKSSSAKSAALFDEVFLRRLERFNFRTARTLRAVRAGERRSIKLQPALDFSDHRPYAPGDDWRYLDWNAYSRHEELFVKLGETSQSVNVHILLDSSRSMAWSGGKSRNPRSNKWDRARRLAGALSYMGLAGGERLEVTPFAHTLGNGFGPIQGKRQAISMLNFLSEMEPVSSPTSSGGGLVTSLRDYARRHPYGGVMVLISDLLDTAAPTESVGEWEELSEGLRYFPPPRWQVLVMHLLTESEMDPKFEGDFDLRDVETGEMLPFYFDEATLFQYRLRVHSWCAQLQTACAARAATYARVLAEWPFERAVIPYLRQRGAIQ